MGKEDMQVAGEQTKKHSVCLVTMEMKIKITVRQHNTFTEMSMATMTGLTKCWREYATTASRKLGKMAQPI